MPVDTGKQKELWMAIARGEDRATENWNEYCAAQGVVPPKPRPDPVDGPPYYVGYLGIIPVAPTSAYLEPENQWKSAPPGFPSYMRWEDAAFGSILEPTPGTVANFRVFKASWTAEELKGAHVSETGGAPILVGPWGMYVAGTGHHDAKDPILYKNMGVPLPLAIKFQAAAKKYLAPPK